MSTHTNTEHDAGDEQDESRDAALSEAEKAVEMAKDAQQQLVDVRQELHQKDQRIDELEGQLEDAQQELSQLRDRTGLLETVKSGSSMQIDERAAVLIQTLYNEAWKKQQSSANTKPRASMDYKAAKSALGGCVGRSAIYRTMEKAEALVGNDDLVGFVEESRGSKKNTRLRLNLEGGEVPETVAGQRVTTPEVTRT